MNKNCKYRIYVSIYKSICFYTTGEIMKKCLYLILFFTITMVLFSVDLTEIEPTELLSAAVGKKENNVSISTAGGSLFPQFFVVDKNGNTYIDDLNGRKIGILLFDSNGLFVRRIIGDNRIDGASKLGLDSDDNLLISDNTKILRNTIDDNFEEIISTSHHTIEPHLWNFTVLEKDIIFKDKNENYKKIDHPSLTNEPTENNPEALTRNMDLNSELENFEVKNDIYIDSRGFVFSDKIEKMKEIDNRVNNLSLKRNTDLQMNQVEDDFIPFEYDVPELMNFGIDKDGNTYWYYIGRDQRDYSTIFVYNQSGKNLIKFNTINCGDIASCGFKPSVDYWGNIYVMPVWRELGIKVYKYERQW